MTEDRREQKIYDVIIVGAGPAGLAVGSELAGHLDILVMDKKKRLTQTTKSCFTPNFMWEYGNAQDAHDKSMYPGILRIITNTTENESKWDSQLPGGYSYIRETEILQYWGDEIDKKGGKIVLDCFYRDHSLQDGIVTIFTTDETYHCRLLLDASGYDSMIKKKYPIKENYYWWSVFGGIYKLPDDLDYDEWDFREGDYLLWATYKHSNVAADTPLQKGRPVFEYEILEDRTMFLLLLYLKQSQISLEVMKTEFQYHLGHLKILGAKLLEPKFGWYPSGGTDTPVAEDHVAFIGDAGVWTTPCGWGMAYIIANYKHFAKKVTKLFQKAGHHQHYKEGCKQKFLEKKYLSKHLKLKPYADYEIIFNQIMSHLLANAPAHKIDDFITLFTKDGGLVGNKGPLLVEKIFTLTVRKRELLGICRHIFNYFSLKELKQLMLPEDYPLLFKLVIALIRDLFTESGYAVHHWFQKSFKGNTTFFSRLKFKKRA